jgi:hypothetical protein
VLHSIKQLEGILEGSIEVRIVSNSRDIDSIINSNVTTEQGSSDIEENKVEGE